MPDTQRQFSNPLTLFLSYAQEDSPLRDELQKHLSLLQHQGIITTWSDHQISPGTDRLSEVDSRLSTASIILLLISPDFLASDYYYSVEMQLALRRHVNGEALVIPIILRSVDWHDAPFAHLQVLPRNAIPVMSWPSHDEAFYNISIDIRQSIERVYGVTEPAQYLSSTTVIPRSTPKKSHQSLSPLNRQDRERLLTRVRTIWINDILEKSLYHADLVTLLLQEQPDAVENPWRSVVQESTPPPRLLPVGTNIVRVYDDANGELLILGEPGSGKTTLLLELARDLLQRADANTDHPIPVVFNLSSWAMKQRLLEDWLIEELNGKYQVPRSLAKDWIGNNSVLPLLDGLDEVDFTYQTACVDAINKYRNAHGLLPIVICSRNSDYLALHTHLFVHRAVVIQPLTTEQVNKYLLGLGRRVEGVRLALQEDKALQELATNPLMLSILTFTYQGKHLAALLTHHPPEDRRRVIFEHYVERMLGRRGEPKHFLSQQTKLWLSWLAKQLEERKQTEFYIEQMQFNWLPESWARHLVPVACMGLIYGLLIWLIFSIFNTFMYGPRIGLFFGTVLGLFNVFLYILFNAVIPTLSDKQHAQTKTTHDFLSLGREMIDMIIPMIENRLTYGLIFGVFNGLFYGLLSGMINEMHMDLLFRSYYGFPYGLFIGIGLGIPGRLKLNISPTETLFWSLQSFRGNAARFLLLGVVLGTLYSLSYPLSIRVACTLLSGIVTVLLGGLSNKKLDNRQRLKPNQGIRRSVFNGLIIGLVSGLSTFFVIGFSYGFFNGPFIGLIFGFISGLGVGIWVALQQGGTASILHMILRFLLWSSGYIPRDYSRFLNYAAERILLRRIGGGYIFIHRFILEYFASLHSNEFTHIHNNLQLSSRRKILIGSALFAGGEIIAALAITDLFLNSPATLLYVYLNHTDQVTSVTISPDSSSIASGGRDKVVRVWHAMNGEELFTHGGYSGMVNVVVWSPDGRFIASGSDDGTIQVWNVKQRSYVCTYKGHVGEGNVNSLAWSPDGQYIASGSDNGGILRIWKVDNRKEFLVRSNSGSYLHAISWSAKGHLLAFEGFDHAILVWNVAKGYSIQTLYGHKELISGLAWSPDETYIASCSYDNTCRIWNIKDKESCQTHGDRNTDHIVLRSPDSQCKTFRISNIGQKNPHSTTYKVYSLCWSPDSRFIAIGGSQGVDIWNVENQSHLLHYTEHYGRVYSVSWSPNGQFIASSSSDQTVHVWQAPSTLS